MLRRVKSDVELGVPPKREVLVYAPLSAKQKEMYKAICDNTIRKLVGVEEVFQRYFYWGCFGIKNMYIRSLPVQNRINFRTRCFNLVHPNQTLMFPLNAIKVSAIKVSKCTKYEIKAYNFFRFLVCFQYYKFSFNYMG